MADTVYVGVSGGVDSAVSLALLKDEGYDVHGVFIRTWTPDWMQCTWQDDRRDAMRVCIHLDVPFRELDLTERYKNDVAQYMIDEYKKGNTPNPDVMCNREVKFGGFYDWARVSGAKFIATGHYAQSLEAGNGISLFEGVDQSKDQSYFLWTLTKEILSHTLFPLGGKHKSETRTIAKKYNLPVAGKKDSQGICFLGQVDMYEFLSHYIPLNEGQVIDEVGKIIGTHKGALIYTVGQRHGFTITKKSPESGPWYVQSRDIENNTITVVQKNHMNQNGFVQGQLFLTQVNDIENTFSNGFTATASIRYHGKKYPLTVTEYNHDEKTMSVKISTDEMVANGQSIVLYGNGVCLGGGIVTTQQ